MSEKIYEEAFKYAMEELHKNYIAQDKESDFIFNFNVNYVEDSINEVTVSVASPFMKNQVTSKGSLTIIENKLKEVTGLQNLKINCIVKSENLSEVKTDEKPVEIIEKKVEPKILKNEDNFTNEKISLPKKKHHLLQEEFTFETFIPGDNSNFAYNAALAVSKNPGRQYNPILLYGGSGLGKTHLMQSIGNYIYNNGGEKQKICYDLLFIIKC